MPKKIKTNGLVLTVLISIASTSAHTVLAELKPVSDAELSEVTGQAYISIDKTHHPDQSNLSYTRINLGMDIETKLNADTLELGNYTRDGKPGSDILINDFGLGYIHNRRFFEKYPYIPTVAKPGGGAYQEGEIVPFNISDPYLEFAFDENTNQLQGVRIGFGEAMGLMTGDIRSLTGNIDVSIRDKASGLRAVSSEQSGGNFFEQALVLLTPFLVNGDVYTQAALVDEHGNANAVRSSTIGMVNGSDFSIEDVDGFATGAVKALDFFGALSSSVTFDQTSQFGCGLFGLFSCNTMRAESQDCSMLGVQTCFPLSSFNTLPVGELSNDKKRIVAPASGMFLSFQTKDGTPWSTTAKATDAMSAEDYMNTTQGAFFNVPTGAVEVNLYEVYRGTPAVRQEFIDRGRGLF